MSHRDLSTSNGSFRISILTYAHQDLPEHWLIVVKDNLPGKGVSPRLPQPRGPEVLHSWYTARGTTPLEHRYDDICRDGHHMGLYSLAEWPKWIRYKDLSTNPPASGKKSVRSGMGLGDPALRRSPQVIWLLHLTTAHMRQRDVVGVKNKGRLWRVHWHENHRRLLYVRGEWRSSPR